jgi:hypothetical protein
LCCLVCICPSCHLILPKLYWNTIETRHLHSFGYIKCYIYQRSCKIVYSIQGRIAVKIANHILVSECRSCVYVTSYWTTLWCFLRLAVITQYIEFTGVMACCWAMHVHRRQLDPYFTPYCDFFAQIIVFMIFVFVQKCVRDRETSFYVFFPELSYNTLVGLIHLQNFSDCP